MKAIRFARFGGPEVLTMETVSTCHAEADEIVVEVGATAVNPSDVKNIRGFMSHTTLPRTPGRDFAGVVREGPSGLIGADVFGCGGELGFVRDGTHAEYVRLPRGGVVVRPRRIGVEQAAGIGVPFVTALACLRETDGLRSGQTVLVSGATGAVGGAACQIAAWKGLRVLGTVRRASDAPRILGEMIDLSAGPLDEQVRRLTAGRGADIFIDTVGLIGGGLRAIAEGGRVAVISHGSERVVPIDLLDLYRRNLHLTGINSLLFDACTCARLLTEMIDGFERGALRPPSVGRVLGLEQAAQAYQAVEEGAPARVILRP